MINNSSIHNILKDWNNDYSLYEDRFLDSNWTPLLSGEFLPIKDWGMSASVIISTYNSLFSLEKTLLSLEKQFLLPQQKWRVEIIVIDDGSTDNTVIFLEKYKSTFKFKYKSQKNSGRSFSRNRAVEISKGEVLFFIDSDLILEPHFLNEHLGRHVTIDNCLLVSFKEKVDKNSEIVTNLDVLEDIFPNIQTDYRFYKSIKNVRYNLFKEIQIEKLIDSEFRILEETGNFKYFWWNRIVGIWDLPSMVITWVSMKRSKFLKFWWYSILFKWWGLEDRYLGACALATGNYIIPVFSTGFYHIEHPNRESGGEESRMRNFQENLIVYNESIKKAL